MLDSKTLANSLSRFAGIGGRTTASALTPPTDQPLTSEKLQLIVGDPGQQRSTFYQVTPGEGGQLLANPLTPLQGDEIFYMGLQPGSRFSAHDGSWWEITEYDWGDQVTVVNVWYPRVFGVCSVADIRKAIYAWIEPFQQVVPAVPIGVDYGVLETRAV